MIIEKQKPTFYNKNIVYRTYYYKVGTDIYNGGEFGYISKIVRSVTIRPFKAVHASPPQRPANPPLFTTFRTIIIRRRATHLLLNSSASLFKSIMISSQNLPRRHFIPSGANSTESAVAREFTKVFLSKLYG